MIVIAKSTVRTISALAARLGELTSLAYATAAEKDPTTVRARVFLKSMRCCSSS